MKVRMVTSTGADHELSVDPETGIQLLRTGAATLVDAETPEPRTAVAGAPERRA